MSKSQRLKSILNKAKGKEKKYDWLGAAGFYEQALRAVGKRGFLRNGEIQDRIGHCFYRAAFQTESQEEFKGRMGLSVEAYEEAAGLFERLEDSKKHARINFCKGMASYNRSWLAEDSSERKVLLDECRKLEKEALKVYEETGDRLGYGKTCNELLTCLYDRSWLAWDFQEGKNIVEEAMEYGEKAIEALSEVEDEYELARAHYMLSLHLFGAVSIYESVEKQNEIMQKGLTYAQKSLDISERMGDSYLIGMSNWAIGYFIAPLKGDFESSLRYTEKALDLGASTKDNLMIALACDLLAYFVWWKTHMEEDPDKRRKGYEKAIQYAEDAITHYLLISYPFTEVYMSHIESFWYLARDETSLKEKRVLLEKAVGVGREHLEQAKRSGSPYVTHYVLHSLGKALYSLSALETKKGEKRRLLEEASEYRGETINILERSSPFSYWNRGVMYNYSALIKAELAKIETNNEEKVDLVRKAVLSMEDCLKFCKTHIEARPRAMLFGSIGQYQYWFGDILNQLYLLTGEKRHLERAIRVYGNAVQAWGKADRHSRIAETYWQIAKLHGYLGEHSKATSEFESAAEIYKLAAEKIPQLKEFYKDHALYMQAWSEIEKAKHNHARGQYGQAKEHYEKAANLHESTERWSYLSPNYSAWARLEEAEDLSRREQTEEAKDLLQQAAKLFAEAKKSIKTKLERIEARDEKEMVADLVNASDIRCEYCLGRIALEEAKILDRKGDHMASSKKYGSATEKFQKATEAIEDESDRKELKPIVCLCRAWQMMTRAEAEASPDLYKEASELFEEAKDHSLSEKAKMLALGHSNFCKALEAGTRFEAIRDTALHTLATQHLEGAASYYLRAGFKNASEYAEATQKLLDAYLYMHNAKTETNPAKKARFYMMAEKVLQASAGSYFKAKHPEKQEQVTRLLEKVKKEKELALSLSEVLHAPLATSTTATFTTPTPTKETPIGLERFENADIQANLIIRVKEVNVGEDVDFRVELVNAGKAPALLIKVDAIVPEGFEIKEVPEMYTFEDSYINMKGKRLNPLKTEDVKMIVKPMSKGVFIMKPRILYIDETGKYKSHEPEPVTITVKELGIKGWIKG